MKSKHKSENWENQAGERYYNTDTDNNSLNTSNNFQSTTNQKTGKSTPTQCPVNTGNSHNNQNSDADINNNQPEYKDRENYIRERDRHQYNQNKDQNWYNANKSQWSQDRPNANDKQINQEFIDQAGNYLHSKPGHEEAGRRKRLEQLHDRKDLAGPSYTNRLWW